jgi:hypothetical protein
MSDFEQLRGELQQARQARDDATAGIGAAREWQRRLARDETALDRVFDARNQAHVQRREQLRQERRRAGEEFDARVAARQEATLRADGLVAAIGIFTDPRKGIEQLHDDIPILLMPVRLETRFKTVEVPGAPARNQLWLRIYPDDCWVDTFEPTLTESEVGNARAYWAGIWQAGGVEAQQRGAWGQLVSQHGSGRAAWIVQQFQPVNLASAPVKADPADLILAIVTQVALASAEEAALLAYWRAALLAGNDGAAAATARAVLDAAVGAARAAELVRDYVPVNFGTVPAGGPVTVSAAIVVLPMVATRQAAWSSAPKVTLMPDRFVFIGYATPGDAEPLVQVGNPVPTPLVIGPDPAAPEADQLRHDAAGNVIVPDELLWLSDFDRAVELGMGLRIDLTPAQASAGFARVLVTGLRLVSGEDTARQELETLLRHHAASGNGVAVLPQGTPTNNTEAAGSGFGRFDDPDASFDALRTPRFTPTLASADKRDGQWLAEYLGVDPALFAHTPGAEATDQRAGRAMNTALWPATLGYWMETMMSPLFGADTVAATRRFFNRHVLGAGACPALRIGAQPYGILPATALSRMRWLEGREIADRAFLQRLYTLLLKLDADAREMAGHVSHVGKAGDPHQLLLDIVGLHPGSVEWSQRTAESLKTLFNRLNMQGFAGLLLALVAAAQRQQSIERLASLGAPLDPDDPASPVPAILDLVFSGRHNALTGGVVDDVPLSETDGIRAWTDTEENYIDWLIEAAGTSLDALYAQDGFKNDAPPRALLYLMLRHALQLGYHDVSVRLYENAGMYTAEQAVLARQDEPFLHIREQVDVSESRYQPLYASADTITGEAGLPLHRYIAAQLHALPLARGLGEQIAALQRLAGEPTARLERAFADHVDCCGYRLDAWLQGLLHLQLGAMRNLADQEGDEGAARTGIHLGAYAWLENLVPDQAALAPVVLDDPELAEVFKDGAPLTRDSANQGYIHAPSLNHAVTAAVLRNGFLSNASSANAGTLAVNLTSERVRTALGMLEGIRSGQSLSDLLGYQLERGLHDRHGTVEVDAFIYRLRRAFPLRADRMASTRPPEGVSIEAIEARNVINGLALVEHVKASGNKTYPFGKPVLQAEPATPAQQAAINAEVDRLLEAHDAVADLALSEGVYQAVLGNYDRVASTYDAYARGNFPPEPDVVKTPLQGTGLTHRFALHLDPAASPAVSPVPGVAMTPRGQAEPALNAWLAGRLPPQADVGVVVSYREAATGTLRTRGLTLRDIALQPADLVALLRDDNQQAMSEIDDRIERHVALHFAPRPDQAVLIRYMDKDGVPFSVFELLPLVRSLRRLVDTARPLRATDLSLVNEARTGKDVEPFVDKARLVTVQAGMTTLQADLQAFLLPVEAMLADLPARESDLVDSVDAHIGQLVALLERAARCVLAQAGWGFAYDFRRRTYAALLAQCAALALRWDGQLALYHARVADAALAGTDEEKTALLVQAELAISTVLTTPPPPPAAYLAQLQAVTLPAFEARKAQVEAIASTTRGDLSLLLADVAALLPVDLFDNQPFTLAERRAEIVRFTQDAVNVGRVVLGELARRIDGAQDLFDEHDAAATPASQVTLLENAAKMLLGEQFHIIPAFRLGADEGAEAAKALAASQSGDLFAYLTAPPEPEREPLDFPVDHWLYGIARVRERLHAWEQLLMFGGALGRPEPALEPLQLPFAAGESWLALEFPPATKLDRDHLLYTAHFAVAFDQGAPQCGLLLDEWTETIPGTDVDTGIAFHHDRPNSEAPQAMLLVTPSQQRGAWRWDDLVDALNETLDLSKRRAIEPVHVDASPYGPLVPATVVAHQASQLTIALNLALNLDLKAP